MATKFLKTMLLTFLFSSYITTARAEIMQEITEGCSTDGVVFGLCILLSPTYTITTIVVVPSEWTGTGWGAKSKIIYKAKNDAASFVATNGQIKGSYLEAAFNLLYAENAHYKSIDELTLAKAIMAYDGRILEK